jgi:hypothetical protein
MEISCRVSFVPSLPGGCSVAGKVGNYQKHLELLVILCREEEKFQSEIRLLMPSTAASWFPNSSTV